MILFIDDEKRIMESYVLEMEMAMSDHAVVLKNDVDDALKFVENNGDDIKLIVLDIMMPSGNAFNNLDTENGLRTGIHFFQRVRQKLPELPIIIFTNVSDGEVENKFYNKHKCWFMHKGSFLPYEFVEEVKRILNKQP